MLGKRKRDTQNHNQKAATSKKTWQKNLENESDEENSIDLNDEDQVQKLQQELKNQSKQNVNKDLENKEEAEFEKKRQLEQERQQKLIQQELEEEIAEIKRLDEINAIKNDTQIKVPVIQIKNENLVHEGTDKNQEQDIEKDKRTIFVWNIHEQANEKDLDLIFGDYGNIINIDLLRAEGLTLNKGRGFIEFENSEQAQQAVDLVNEKIELRGKLLMCLVGVSAAQNAKSKLKESMYEENKRIQDEIEEKIREKKEKRKQERKDREKQLKEERKRQRESQEEEGSEYEEVEVSYDEEDEQDNEGNQKDGQSGKQQDEDSVQINTFL